MESRSLSKTQAKVILSLEAENQDLVTLAELQKRAGVSAVFARKLSHDLVRRGWLQRVRRGVYLLNPSRHGPDALPDTDPLRVGRRLVEPYYFGYATAAELHGLFPQASRVYYIVTPQRYTSAGGATSQFHVVRTARSRFFGTLTLVRRGEPLVVSDPERTLVDCLDRPEFSGGLAGVAQMFALAKPRLNWRRFGGYLDRFGHRSLDLRAGYLMERVRPSLRPPPPWVRARLPRPGDPFVLLGPPSIHGRRGPRDHRWHIVRNLSDAQLFAEGEAP
ncbi:MAG TPA: type IV toxin-antitoxin system AbiEi family antitoxin [Thermoplasmata archaeon]|nr:type IV toxin-antitoxin system AbiEi family antitoxin [Thermoplasmata archaeon]